MEAVRNLENTLAEWYKNAPHLPKDLRKWLGSNVWWLVLIGVVLSVFGIFTSISALLLVMGLSSLAMGAASYNGYMVGAAVGTAWIGLTLVIVTLVVTTVLMAMAVSPLKAKAKKGWRLLFLVTVVNAVLGLVGGVISLNIFTIVSTVFWTALWAAVEGYFLFEIRDEFGKVVAKSHAESAKK